MSAAFRRACASALGAAALASMLPSAMAQAALQETAQVPAQAPSPDPVVPSFAALEAAGATVGEVRVVGLDIFDLEDPKENYLLFRLANRLHIQTRPGVIERSLLFKRGDPLSVRLIEETERLLRNNRYLYDVKISPLAYRDGVVDIEVQTRDTWSLDAGFSFGRAGGANSSRVSLREYNLLGTGIYLNLGRSSTVDRSGVDFQIQNNHAFDGWTALRYSRARNSDGTRQAASVLRPFYALDARWSAGASVSKDDRIDAVYRAGAIASQYRHQQDQAEAFGGWSQGLVDGRTRRYSIGVTASDDVYRPEPGRVPPARLPSDQKIVAPFFRYELVEDAFERMRNRDQIGRPEFFALGFGASLQLGRALSTLGASQDLWLYSGSMRNGFVPLADHDLLASVALSGQYGGGAVRRQLLSAAARYYLPVNKRILLYGAASADVLKNPDLPDLLTLGGDNGLRGYPLRYQTGERRALFTAEVRAYTDPYLFRLFRIGGAAFYDIGRAWGGPDANPVNAGWLSNAGVGLRFFSVRSAFGNVLHVDLAIPLNRDASIKPVQFLVKTRTSF